MNHQHVGGHSLRGSRAAETAGFTVLEPVNNASLPCSPPIPTFPPIREKGGGCVEFPKERLSQETASKLIGLPSP